MPSKGGEMRLKSLAFRPTAQATSPITDRTRRANPHHCSKVATRTHSSGPRNHQPGGGGRSESRRAIYLESPDYAFAASFVNTIPLAGTEIPPEYEMQ